MRRQGTRSNCWIHKFVCDLCVYVKVLLPFSALRGYCRGLTWLNCVLISPSFSHRKQIYTCKHKHDLL